MKDSAFTLSMVILIAAMLICMALVSGCSTPPNSTEGEFNLPPFFSAESKTRTAPGRDVGSSFEIDGFRVTGRAAEIMAARFGEGIDDLSFIGDAARADAMARELEHHLAEEEREAREGAEPESETDGDSDATDTTNE